MFNIRRASNYVLAKRVDGKLVPADLALDANQMYEGSFGLKLTAQSNYNLTFLIQGN